eukprot:1341378-Rhodomonas_salina.1
MRHAPCAMRHAPCAFCSALRTPTPAAHSTMLVSAAGVNCEAVSAPALETAREGEKETIEAEVQAKATCQHNPAKRAEKRRKQEGGGVFCAHSSRVPRRDRQGQQQIQRRSVGATHMPQARVCNEGDV